MATVRALWDDPRMGLAAEIWCLRHGESSNVVTGQSGARPGAALTRTGRAQAVAAAATLATLGRRPTRVYASTAVRAMQTADVLVSGLALREPLIPLNGLVEVGIGRHEGGTDEPIHAETARFCTAGLSTADSTPASPTASPGTRW
jgi:alpha-ribazole phosphatase/probable phosphoglycerate mutase